MVVPRTSPWVSALLHEFHATPGGSHTGALRTYIHLAAFVYWPGMIRWLSVLWPNGHWSEEQIRDQVTHGVVEPTFDSNKVWEDISMDFITGLLRSGGLNCILVVVDRFSKYGHFLGLRHPFTAKSVSDVFIRDVVRLHGVLASIVLYRDPLF